MITLKHWYGILASDKVKQITNKIVMLGIGIKVYILDKGRLKFSFLEKYQTEKRKWMKEKKWSCFSALSMITHVYK